MQFRNPKSNNAETNEAVETRPAKRGVEYYFQGLSTGWAEFVVMSPQHSGEFCGIICRDLVSGAWNKHGVHGFRTVTKCEMLFEGIEFESCCGFHDCDE